MEQSLRIFKKLKYLKMLKVKLLTNSRYDRRYILRLKYLKAPIKKCDYLLIAN